MESAASAAYDARLGCARLFVLTSTVMSWGLLGSEDHVLSFGKVEQSYLLHIVFPNDKVHFAAVNWACFSQKFGC